MTATPDPGCPLCGLRTHAGPHHEGGDRHDSHAPPSRARRLVAPPTGRCFPGPSARCLMTAVVPAYRWGAVPDSYRVPSYPRGPGVQARLPEPAT
jgi:hypothetical protein